MHPLGCRQHGATGGQGLGVQETPVSTGVAPVGQELPPKTWKQAPVFGLQHALTQGLGLQEVFGNQTPLVQFTWKVVTQLMAPLMQHAPRGGQGEGTQDEPPKGVELGGQVRPKPTRPHAPVLLLQQTRTQGLGLQAVLVPNH